MLTPQIRGYLLWVKPTIWDENVPNKWRNEEREFLEEKHGLTSLFRDLCWRRLLSGLGRSQVWKLGRRKLEEIRSARNTRECVYVLAAVYMTAENLLRIFPKGSKLKENTNFALAHDLTGLERGSRSQSWMTERSLFKPSPSSAVFSGLFSFSAVPSPQRWIPWSGSPWFIGVKESAGQQRGGRPTQAFFIHFPIKRHDQDVLPACVCVCVFS